MKALTAATWPLPWRHARVFACRQCHRLAYRSQREADDDRAIRRADTIRRRLGWEPGILNGNGLKPKGMHWRTFERLQRGHDAHVNAALVGMAARLARVRMRFGDIDADPIPGFSADAQPCDQEGR